MICPRCAYDSIDKLYTSPVLGVWDVLQCQQCLCCWRTSEPDRRTKPEAYPQQFKMTLEDIKNAAQVPTIPPLVSTPQAQLLAPRSDKER